MDDLVNLRANLEFLRDNIVVNNPTAQETIAQMLGQLDRLEALLRQLVTPVIYSTEKITGTLDVVSGPQTTTDGAATVIFSGDPTGVVNTTAGTSSTAGDVPSGNS